MKRRRFVQALVAIPAAAPLAAQPPAQAQTGNRGAAAADDPKLEVAAAENAADGVPSFFTPAQFSALRKVSDLLAPPIAGSPGALAAGAPEFLDFLMGKSDAARQAIYRAGLDGLDDHAKQQFNKPFADLDNSQADTLLASLRTPWTFEEPSDPVARFLRAAKSDVRTATANSPASSAGGRRFSGSGLYWYSLD
jgi:hypothetical protein